MQVSFIQHNWCSLLLISIVGLFFSAHALSDTCTPIESTEKGSWYKSQADIMGTEIEVELWHKDSEAACDAIATVMQEMHRIDAEMSPYKATSQLSKMNSNASQDFVEVSDELFELLTRSQGYSILTGGAFDITYASAGRFYDYRKGLKPDAEQLREAVKGINYRHLELNHKRRAVRYHHDHVYVDLGGIAKGHAVDQAIQRLVALGIDQARVTAGGDSRILGDRFGEPWVVGVRDPRNKQSHLVVLPLIDASVSTSGDYERFFEKDGVRYHHIIDPDSGDSAREVRSVTVIGAESTATDALSTSVFVMGVKEGLELIDRLVGIDAIVVDRHGEVHVSDGLMPLTQKPAVIAGAYDD